MKVKERMRTAVARVSPAATVAEVLSRMDGSGVTSLPVEDAEGFLLMSRDTPIFAGPSRRGP